MSGPWEDYQVANEPGAKPAPVSGPWEKYGAAPASTPPAVANAPQPPAVSDAGAVPSGPPKNLDEALAQAHADSNPLVRGAANLADTVQRSPITGALETGLAAGGNLVGKIGSGLAGVVSQGTNALGLTDTPPADVVRGVQDATRYIPQTQGARDIGALANTATKPVQAVAAPIDKAIANAGPAVSTFVPAASEAAQDVASILPFGQAARAGKAASVVEGAAKPAVSDPLATVRGAGYVARPSDVRATGAPAPGLVREALTSSSGQAKSAGITNQKISTGLAADDMKVPGATRLNDVDFDNFRANGPGPVYEATAKKAGKMPADQGTVDTLNAISRQAVDPANGISAKAAGNIDRISKKIQSGNYNGDSWLKDVAQLRKDGAREGADALEGMMESHLAAQGDTTTLNAMRGARTDFAKSYDWQRATSQRGQVDAQHMAALDAKYPGLLTGNAKLVATAGRLLPDVTRVPGGGVADLATSSGHTGLIAGAGRIAGAAIKHAIPGMNPLSESFQARNFGRQMTPTEQSYVPSFGKRPEPASPQMFGPARQIGYEPGGTPIPMGNDTLQSDPFVPGHPGEARPASLGTVLANRPLALPAPGGTVIPLPNHLGSELDAARASREATATAQAPGAARGAGFDLRQDNAPAALPAPGGLAPRGAQVPAIKVTPGGNARLSDPVRDFSKDDAGEGNPSEARPAGIGTILARKDRYLTPSVGRQVQDSAYPSTVDDLLAAIGVKPKNPARIREDYVRQRAQRKGED